MKWLACAVVLPVLAGAVLAGSGKLTGIFGRAGDLRELQGIWYEQSEYADVLTIKGSRMKLATWNGYEEETPFKLVKSRENGYLELVPEDEYFKYVDLWYDTAEEKLIFHTLPHMDGDGGYHTVIFLKTAYVAPPPPVYGERKDNSDPDAQHEFEDHTVRRLSLHIYEPGRESYDMAPEQPVQGEYSYELETDEDGNAFLTSDFYPPGVEFSAERMAELTELLSSGGIDAVNGLDIWTEEMPEDTMYYELETEYGDGSVFRSRANGPDVPYDLFPEGTIREIHKLLFEAFPEAGYNIWSGEFHSTKPMKRLMADPDLRENMGYSVSSSGARIEITGKKYDYPVYSEYPVFTVEQKNDTDPADADLRAVGRKLDEITAFYKDLSGSDVVEEDGIMQDASVNDRAETDRRTSYSFYSPLRFKYGRGWMSFWISEGHSNAYGLGPHGYGDYRYIRYCIDTGTGKLMSASDLFVSTDTLCGAVSAALDKRYNYPDYSYGEYFHSTEYKRALSESLEKPESEGGTGFEIEYDKITLYLEGEVGTDDGYQIELPLYYDALQDILDDRYVCVW
ncbi:MAG: hypothetical protein J6P87_04740 [Lachnospiraceae bacterium]|nr:hypothetical protein [Lachnospiraceae bacterium]